jgi:hypothetical protein
MSAESSDALEDSITSLAIDVDTTGQNSKETLKRTLKWLSNSLTKPVRVFMKSTPSMSFNTFKLTQLCLLTNIDSSTCASPRLVVMRM